jgi:Animal haem peroxidase
MPTRPAYASLFPELPPLRADEAFLHALGRPGGACDGGTGADQPGSLGAEAAGWPFFGQFVAHDITADRSTLAPRADPAGLRNARSPRLNLQSLYGDGPAGHPFLFQRNDPAKLLMGPGGRDVPRNQEGTAIIADPRNDSYVVLSQMQLAFIRAHNAFVDLVRAEGTPEAAVFDAAARELRWHYQTAILREFLPRLIGPDLVAALLVEGPRYYRPGDEPFIPLEFAHAAYRYGHSQIRHRYVLNDHSGPVRIFPDLLGFRPVARDHVIDWARLFDAPARPPAVRAKKIDGRLAGGLIALPVAVSGECPVEAFHSLAVRDLVRGLAVGLASGEAVARHLGDRPLTRDEIWAGASGWTGETPLWYYVLREAAVRGGGDRLGPVGGRIVGDVLVGLLACDPASVRHAPDDWRPRASLIEMLAGIRPRMPVSPGPVTPPRPLLDASAARARPVPGAGSRGVSGWPCP